MKTFLLTLFIFLALFSLVNSGLYLANALTTEGVADDMDVIGSLVGALFGSFLIALTIQTAKEDG